jgi:hypothetical protein
MQYADAGAYHERAWNCLQEANRQRDQGRRAIFTTAAFMWRTLARDIEDAAVREIQRATQLVDDAHEGWLRAELAIAQVSKLATAFEAAPGLGTADAFMASFVEYRDKAAECARLALIAPSEPGRASFDAAAKHWAMLFRLAAANSIGAECPVASGGLGNHEHGKASGKNSRPKPELRLELHTLSVPFPLASSSVAAHRESTFPFGKFAPLGGHCDQLRPP